MPGMSLGMLVSLIAVFAGYHTTELLRWSKSLSFLSEEADRLVP